MYLHADFHVENNVGRLSTIVVSRVGCVCWLSCWAVMLWYILHCVLSQALFFSVSFPALFIVMMVLIWTNNSRNKIQFFASRLGVGRRQPIDLCQQLILARAVYLLDSCLTPLFTTSTTVP